MSTFGEVTDVDFDRTVKGIAFGLVHFTYALHGKRYVGTQIVDEKTGRKLLSQRKRVHVLYWPGTPSVAKLGYFINKKPLVFDDPTAIETMGPTVILLGMALAFILIWILQMFNS